MQSQIFTVTERGTFKRCRRRWDYASLNRMGITPVMGSPNLALGLVIHKALENWMGEYQARQDAIANHLDVIPGVHDLERLFLMAAAEELANVKRRYRANVGADASDVELGDLYEAIALGRQMMLNYQEYYKTPIPEGFRLIKAEQQVIVKVPGTIHRLEAKFDVLLECVIPGEYNHKLFILDHKTYKARARDSSIQQNDQFLAYLWALAQVYGLDKVGGFIYDGLWKRERPPKNGAIADLFHRKSSIRPRLELLEFGKHLCDELREMGSPKTAIYPNRQWQGCWDCGFEKLCAAQSRGENWQYLLSLDYTKRSETQVTLDLEEIEQELAEA